MTKCMIFFPISLVSRVFIKWSSASAKLDISFLDAKKEENLCIGGKRRFHHLMLYLLNPFNTDLLQCTMQILFKTKQLNVVSEVFIEFKNSLLFFSLCFF